MSDMLTQLYKLLMDVILPNLKGIQAAQAEQRMQTQRLHCDLDEFRAEMQLRFADLRAEIAACRNQIEDAMVTLAEKETSSESGSLLPSAIKKTLIH